ncbi:TPA: flagellar hook-associated protein FlgK [Salmonella enterica]|uniref:Flagellar hook-associated protein 1 n=1 Tax=Salmonella enterica TaxID=28901 RepID=A0A756YCR0_SALER|nr:flagellar hook-associated protein FlgK [Salmonella enterica subsp. enterica serovar Richmond]HAG0390739.1 flagellar hook-associated protein FlgK [Salmonella enterica]
MSLLSLAQNGLSAAQAALNVVGNNLTNAVTPGYSRQSIDFGEAGGKTSGKGFFGYGVTVEQVQRMYDGFLNNQVRGASTEFSTLNTRYKQVSQIDDMLGNSTNNLSSKLNNMFTAMEGVSKDPADPSARQDVFSQLNAIANQFRSNSNTLNGLEKSTNTQIRQTVNDINSYCKQIAELNGQIAKMHGQTGGMPSDLLDKRDQLLNKLSEQVGIKVKENNDTGCVTVTMNNGQSLVIGEHYSQMAVRSSDGDPNQLVVSYIDSAGNEQYLKESSMTGKLGGLFKFRDIDMKDAKNQLDQLALQMEYKFNEVNASGYDRNGAKGGNIFTLHKPQAISNSNNKGNASLDVDLTNVPAVKAEDYTITYNGVSWEVKTSSGRTIIPTVNGGKISFEGITITPLGTAKAQDSFTLNPVAGSADGIKVSIKDGDQIAASSSADKSDQSNNENIRALIGLKDDAFVGNKTLAGAYASLVSSVGSTVRSLKGEQDTAYKSYDQWQQQQQSVVGVDLNEEYVNLQMFSQYYQANAQVLKTANSIFDTLLSIR